MVGPAVPAVPVGFSATPIYDALCAEYRSLFRALPGDRTGEEDLRYVGFDGIRGAFGWRERPRALSRGL